MTILMKTTPTPRTHPLRAFTPKRALTAGALALSLGLASCGGGTSSTSGNAVVNGGAELVRVLAGRLTDVYGFRTTSSGAKLIELYERDVIVGPDILDERDGNSGKADEEVQYDFISVDTATLQPRLLITREIGSDDFVKLFNALDDKAIEVDARAFGDDVETTPFRAIPRNAGFRIDFSKDLGLTEDFFLAKDQDGRVRGIRNPEAVQLLEIVGDPRDNVDTGDFRLIPTRIAYKGKSLVLDPVILGGEGQSYNLTPTARGLPESPNSKAPNVRIAIALEGPLRMPGIAGTGAANGLVSKNLAARKSVVRDLRAGNSKDSNFWVANGFVRDDTPPRLVGEMALRLQRVEVRSASDQRLILWKAGISHDIDVGDTLRLFDSAAPEEPVAVTDVAVDPVDDAKDPGVQRVTVQVRDASAFEAYDPSRRNDFPTDPKELDAWLLANAPVCVLSTEFNGEKDDPLNFLSFTPKPIPDPQQTTVAQNRNIRPDASIIVRFTKPVDLGTVRPLDTLIFSTKEDTTVVLDAKKGTPGLILGQIFDEDGSQTALRSSPPVGFYLDDEMRKPANKDLFPYYLHLVGGFTGIRDLGGKPLDFQFLDPNRRFVSFPFYLDTNMQTDGSPRFPNNIAITVARRFLARDEDGDDKNEDDAFGAIIYLNGAIQGRPTSRVSSFVDDRNQLPSPPAPPLSYCGASQAASLTGATPFGQPIQNPLNPLGARLQTLWREIDLSLSRTNPFDFNLDVERIWWAPFQATANAPRTEFDIFDRLTLYLGHSERRPSPCVGVPASLAVFPSSGLNREFFHNYLRDLKDDASSQFSRDQIAVRPDPVVAFKDKSLTIRNEDSVFEPTGVNRFLPLPEFEKERLVWRDERLTLTGGGQGLNRILSPFRASFGDAWEGARWSPINEDGQVGSIALPLLVDFYVYPDDPLVPKDNPWKATGFNGWQISLTVQSGAQPNWRVYSAGGLNGTTEMKVDPSAETQANGGWNPQTGARTSWGDNSCYWACVDFLKRQSVMTFGFIDLTDPHSATKNKLNDSRLGPFTWADDSLPKFETWFDPPLSTIPGGTKLIPEFRGADKFLVGNTTLTPGPHDPLIAGNAHIRTGNSAARGWSNWMHTERLTTYVSDPNELLDPDFLATFRATGPGQSVLKGMTPQTMKLVNWRFTFVNNVEVNPTTTPSLDSFALTYRIEKQAR
ncbi:MAG: hypothetical protein H6832_16810 [Planctomycetes bacterium]|nr:hypothetical protein [Planctomycetota bacterium]MCB9920063.1 hypothetical protein [Planctomycetota bacterium]